MAAVEELVFQATIHEIRVRGFDSNLYLMLTFDNFIRDVRTSQKAKSKEYVWDNSELPPSVARFSYSTQTPQRLPNKEFVIDVWEPNMLRKDTLRGRATVRVFSGCTFLPHA